MRPKQIAQLVPKPNDLDYVEHFQTLSTVNLEIRRHGPSADRLVRKAILELDVGNFSASLTAAQDAAVLEPSNPETHHLVGMAYLMLALVKSGALPSGPGLHASPSESVTALVLHGSDSFREASRLNPGDEESQADFEALKSLLRRMPSDEELSTALRDGLR